MNPHAVLKALKLPFLTGNLLRRERLAEGLGGGGGAQENEERNGKP
jgi:hypothetical protein